MYELLTLQDPYHDCATLRDISKCVLHGERPELPDSVGDGNSK